MRSEEDFFSEFYYPDQIVTDNEGNVEVLSISIYFALWTLPRGLVHEEKISSLSLEF